MFEMDRGNCVRRFALVSGIGLFALLFSSSCNSSTRSILQNVRWESSQTEDDIRNRSTGSPQEKKTLVHEHGVDTSDWIRFRVESYGFEFWHPPDWTVELTTDYAHTQEFVFLGGSHYPELTGDAEALILFPNDVSSAIAQIGSQFRQRNVDQDQTVVNGMKALVVSVTTLEQLGWKDTHVFIEGDAYIYDLNVNLEDRIHQTILKSFTLLD